ncbi:hypothetical protein ACPZ19_32415 [Amycolatopsis lurida]
MSRFPRHDRVSARLASLGDDDLVALLDAGRAIGVGAGGGSAVVQSGGSPAVRARFEALAAASSSLVLLCEYLPDPIVDWLADDPARKAATVGLSADERDFVRRNVRRRGVRRHTPGQLAGHRPLRSGGDPCRRRRDHHPARGRRRADERFLLEAVQRRPRAGQ